MLQWFRVRASRIAVTAIVAMVVVGGSAALPHEDDCHDAACTSMVVEHNAAAHRIGAATVDLDDHGLHCLVCHWVRAFRPPTESRIVSTLTAGTGAGIALAPFTAPAGTRAAQPPLRSPPAAPALA